MNQSLVSSRYELGRRRILQFGFLSVLAPGLLLGPTARARAVGSEEAGTFLLSLTTRAIEQLTNASVSAEERKTRFRALFRDNFDVGAIGRFVLGRYGRGTPKPVLERFLVTFEDVMVERFVPQFTGYGDTRFRVGSVHPVKGKAQFIVSSAITPPGKNTEVQIDWRLRLNDGRFKVLDIVGEGVSMALTLRAEYGSVLKTSGGDVEKLIALLQERMGTQTSAAN